MTVLVGMHLGTHCIVLADRRLSENGALVHDRCEKLKVSKNHASVSGGSHLLGAVGHSQLKGMDIANNEDIKGLADAILGFELKLFGVKAPIRGRTMFMVSAAIDQQAKLFSFELDDFPNGGRVKNHRELLPGEVELGIPAGLTSEQGLDLRKEVTQILSDFMQSRSADLNPENTKGLVGLLVSVGKVLTTLAETTPSISNMFDVAIKSASGLTIQGEINFKKRRIVNLDQLLEKRWVYEVDGFAP